MTGPARLLAIVALALVSATAAAQDAGIDAGPPPGYDAAAEFTAATRLLGAGDLPAAQAAFEAVVTADPAGPWADDALSEAAGIAERRGDLRAALRLWRRIVDEHGSSRQSRRARVRVTAIDHAIGEGGRWLEVAEAHEAIIRAAVRKEDPSPQVAEMVALLAEHPDYPRAHEARMWIGDGWMRLGHAGRAVVVFREARERAVEPADRWRAGKSYGDALAASGDLDGAERVFRELIGEGDAISDRALEKELADLDKMRQRQRLETLALVVVIAALLLFALGAWRATGNLARTARFLILPPVEVWYFLPVAAALIGVSASGNFLVERAVRMILIGGLAVTWLGGASLEAARRRGPVPLWHLALHLVVVMAAICSLCYLAVMDDMLLDMLAETWSHGHDMR